MGRGPRNRTCVFSGVDGGSGLELFFVGFVYIEICRVVGCVAFISLYLTVGGAQYRVSRAPREA